MARHSNRWITHPNPDHDDAPDYELKDEYCHPDTKVWLDFQDYRKTREGNYPPYYQVTLVNRRTGGKIFLRYTDRRRFGEKALFTAQIAKERALEFAKNPDALNTIGIEICQEE